MIIFATLVASSRDVRADESLPRLTYALWANLSYDNDNISGSSAMGWGYVGVDWFRLPMDLATFNTYVGYSHRSRTENQTYFDAGGPLVGAEFRGKYISVGTDYFKQNLPLQGVVSERMQYYVTGFFQWDLGKNPGGAYIGLPGSMWFNETYDDYNYHDPNSQGASTMGFINQGIDWMKFKNGLILSTFAEYRWRYKLVNNAYFDANGPAVGIDVRKDFYNFGVDYFWQWLPTWPYPPGPQMDERLQVYITIYLSNFQ